MLFSVSPQQFPFIGTDARLSLRWRVADAIAAVSLGMKQPGIRTMQKLAAAVPICRQIDIHTETCCHCHGLIVTVQTGLLNLVAQAVSQQDSGRQRSIRQYDRELLAAVATGYIEFADGARNQPGDVDQ